MSRWVTRTVQLGPRTANGGKPNEPSVERVDEHPTHLVKLAAGRPDVRVDGAAQSHCRDAHVGMTDERGDIDAQRQGFDRRNVAGRVMPGLVLLDRRVHDTPRQRLHTGEHVGAVVGVGVHGRQRAVAQDDGGDPVASRFSESWAGEDLGVVMGVHVHHSRDHPTSGGVDRLHTVGQVLADRRDPVAAHPNIGDLGCRAASVEHDPATDH